VTAQARFAIPESYTPRHLAEKILTSRGALEGERKHVTVLFADMKGSMEILADRDPEEVRRILDPVLERMMESVHRYEGTVNQVMGDGIMALFGAPLAHEDHAVRACYAALQMQESVKRLAEDIRRDEGTPVHIRVGINSGEVVVRSIGSDLHMDYTAVGQTTHLAARMEQAATPGSVLLTADTLRLVEEYVRVTPVGPIKIKGLGEPVETYELVGTGRAHTRLEAATARGLTRFVGRGAEMTVLTQALEHAGKGHGQLVGVMGEPGVGKSRLLYEFVHSDEAEAWLVLESGAIPPGQATAGFALVDLLKTYFRIETHDDEHQVRGKVTATLVATDKALEAMLTPLLAVLDVPIEDRQWMTLDPPQRLRLILEAVRQLLLRVSHARPLLLVFDDLQSHDSVTQMFLDRLVESIPRARILLVASYRPEYRHGWGNKSYYAHLRVDALSADSGQELLHALLGDDPGLVSLKHHLLDRTEGNPFFLEESVRTLVETGAFEGWPGAYHLLKDPQAIRVPATVEAVLAARIDRLGPEDKRLLQSAAVVGRDVRLDLLEAIAGVDEDALRDGLARLQAGEFLYEARLFPDPEHRFKHALTHEVTYGSLLQNRRRQLHERLVEALKRRPQSPEQVELLAYHAFRGEVWEDAVRYLRQAGATAASRSAHREAVVRFEQALEALQRLPASRETMERAIDIRFDLRNSLHPLGHFERFLDHLREAEAQAATLGDQRRLGQVTSFMCQYFRLLGDLGSAVSAGERAVAIAERLGDRELWIVASNHLGPVRGALGDYRGGARILGEVVERLQGDLRYDTMGTTGVLSVFSRIYLVCCLAELGEFPRALALGEEGIEIAEHVKHVYSLAFACYGVGTLCVRKGEIERSISSLERGLAICRASNLPLMFPLLGSSLGAAYSMAGRSAQGIALLEETEQHAISMRRMGGHPMLLARLGEAYLRAGRRDDAVRRAERALTLAREQGERGLEAYALRLLGELNASADPGDLAMSETCFRQAVALTGSLGMLPLLAECQQGLARCYGRAGRQSDAEPLFAAAIASFRALDMPFWLERGEAESGSLS
jgi:class 3 adenylate cyclase/tetratricopeptide (TPR) repeat protein